jgi:hypothetical protein
MEEKCFLAARSGGNRNRGRQLTVGPEVAMRAMVALSAAPAAVMYPQSSDGGPAWLQQLLIILHQAPGLPPPYARG